MTNHPTPFVETFVFLLKFCQNAVDGVGYICAALLSGQCLMSWSSVYLSLD